ncbi:MAG: Ig-like domain-containing domain [Candidatus Dadabacteria bacterium]
MPKGLIVSIFVLFISAIVLFSGSGCANIIPPQGGPRDSIPPELVTATPADSTRNFRGNRITLQFNEYVDLQDVSNNLLFTPTFETNPEVSVKLKTVSVRFRDTLAKNTTYVLNFGNAIRDVNESNVNKNFVYVFSTGPALDSLELSGKVILAETGKTDSTLQVLLHKNLDDSAVVKDRPQYVARVDANGNFRFRNLPTGTFKIYALGNAGFARRYLNKNQAFAFLDSAVITGKDNNLTLYAYQETAQKPSTPTTSGKVPAAEKRLQFSTNLSSNQQDLLKDLVMTFVTPLKVFDTTQISLSTDSSFNRVSYNVTLDSTRKVATFKTAWKEATRYNLVLNKDFAEDSSGRKLLKSDTLHFTTKKLLDYAKLTVHIKNVDAKRKPVLQFVQNEQVIFSVPITSGVITEPLFLPGEYSLRVLYDTNGNGKWDPGHFPDPKHQPEIVMPVSRTINVKGNFENEFDIAL